MRWVQRGLAQPTRGEEEQLGVEGSDVIRDDWPKPLFSTQVAVPCGVCRNLSAGCWIRPVHLREAAFGL